MNRRLVGLAMATATALGLAACEDQPRALRRITVLGDVDLGRGTDRPPTNSTQVVEVWEPDPALCHAEDANAVHVSDAIRRWFDQPWWAWSCAVAWCESRFKPYARNGDHYGVWQINHRLWGGALPGADLLSFDGSAAVARHVLDVQGRQAWSCDPWG